MTLVGRCWTVKQKVEASTSIDRTQWWHIAVLQHTFKILVVATQQTEQGRIITSKLTTMKLPWRKNWSLPA